MSITAVKFKINSIQDYIYRSNKLRINIGASEITSKHIYELLKECISKQFLDMSQLDITSYSKNEDAHIFNNSAMFCEIGDIGGGGALLFFQEDNQCLHSTKLIREFSKQILIKYPGLNTSFAVKANFDKQNFKTEIEILEKKVNASKNQNYSCNVIPSLGFQKLCPFSGESIESDCKESLESISVSRSVKIKDESANDSNNLVYKGFSITKDIEKLGQNPEAGYIAVVHIDGNKLGSKIAAANSLNELRTLSNTIQKKANESFNSIIQTITESSAFQELYFSQGEKTLPIRPLLSGGDDITFICEGRIGIYLAEKFIMHFVGDGQVIEGACAGVCIVKTKFPFYKAYIIAEELIKEAKKASRPKPGSSYLSFFYSSSTFSGNLESIRERTHETLQGNKYYGPYRLDDPDDSKSINRLKNGIRNLIDSEVLSIKKIHELRDVIEEEKSDCELFETRYLKAKPRIWDNKSTFYFDQIELMEFYPYDLLIK